MELAHFKELRRISALATLGATLMAGCGGENTRVDGEFVHGVRIQRFHPSASGRFYTEVIQQCDDGTLVETVIDVGYHFENGKKVYDTDVDVNFTSDSRRCEDGELTPEDYAGEDLPASTVNSPEAT